VPDSSKYLQETTINTQSTMKGDTHQWVKKL